MFQENGPFLWQKGTTRPVRNPWAWDRLTNMLWVEQPVGTGYSYGRKTAHSEKGVAEDFVGFFKNWEKLFGIENYKIFLTVTFTSSHALTSANIRRVAIGRIVCRPVRAVHCR